MEFNFQFGKTKPNKKQLIVTAVILSMGVSAVAGFLNLDKKTIWCQLDQYQRKFFPDTVVNDILSGMDEVQSCRSKKAVDSAIEKYEKETGGSEVRIPPPLYSEKPIDETVCHTDKCKDLGGEMRLCSPWMPGCEGVPISNLDVPEIKFSIEKLKDDFITFFKF